MISDKDESLTDREIDRIERFLDLFTGIEATLQKRLGVPSKTKFSQLLVGYREINPFWEPVANELQHFAQIRNFLTHERAPEFGYPVSVTKRSVSRLEAILLRLRGPRTIGESFRCDVTTVESNCNLVDILRLAYENAFSQFPVIDGGKFKGVVTENEITRWLGHQVTRGLSTVDLAGVTVQQVMREREPGRPVVFEFQRLDHPEQEVMGMFQKRATLEVVLLTESGGRNTGLSGIVTQWDSARYSSARV